METITQLLLGSLVLGLCAIVHVSMIATGVPLLTKVAVVAESRFPRLKIALTISAAFAWIVISHTLQVWIWAAAFLLMNVFKELATAIYFSMVTYTTLGYGDIVLAEGVRNFASFAAITGILTFGVSTAFLVTLIGRILPKEIG